MSETSYGDGEKWELIQGDCLEVLKTFADESIDACVTDPPAGISFMGKTWDSFTRKKFVGFIRDVMKEVLRVLKPGGHALVWAIPRTSHWTATAIEDAGFEIRDKFYHHFSTGMSKSLDVSKAIDKAAKVERPVIGTYIARGYSDHSPTEDGRNMWAAGEVSSKVASRTAPATEAAKMWDGYGTALAPSTEEWILARKPLIGTVAANVIKYGTGALNVDACRIKTSESLNGGAYSNGARGSDLPGAQRSSSAAGMFAPDGGRKPGAYQQPPGRWPKNCVFSHSPDCKQIGTQIVKGDPREGSEGARPGGFLDPGADKGDGKPCGKLYGDTEVPVYSCAPGCVVATLDAQSGVRMSGSRKAGVRKGMGYGGADGDGGPAIEGSTGGASRFFPVFQPDFLYQAKPSRRERESGLDELPAQAPKDAVYGDGMNSASKVRTEEQAEHGVDRGKVHNTHPTVKSIALMRWLCKLIGGQPGSIILDPFAGSGSILIAALLEGFKAVGIEREREYTKIARRRIKWWQRHGGKK